ncbi:MAG: hypothetical protein ACREPX_06430 [Rhodanobacteraceae bacterium]
MKRLSIILIVLCLAGCADLQRSTKSRTARAGAVAAPALQGEYDNHAQVWKAHEAGSTAAVPPHVVINIEPAQGDWSIWRIRLDAAPPLEATWAMRASTAADGTMIWTPHSALGGAPAAGAKFEEKQWTPLDACALRGSLSGDGSKAQADVAACTALAPGVGAQAALLPIVVEREGDLLRVRLYADQARGADAREETRLVRWFTGWAAVNGAGPKAGAENTDWHMDRALRLGSEGGRYTLKWRDGAPTGFSLALEHLTYRDGNVPVLKLSVVDDADGRTLAYAWANPEATRIGINLGWVQVGLDSSGQAEPQTGNR